ncbi:M28 family peptidase (plasmid) [Herbiconiux sp. KACC 21604]|uniref:M28 family peptidase n=1 Tax=unclassified Herbiconiux TaxID=2618217 RepID=UPI001492193A|nr:M28 family peptidase [Herbiconiux sp. SALV-R1]QJU56342.1 M28 family peptidase [Herbiconiux sp. SALV-R1]WPO88849.1 M28 family peptidase [Herbiconiux sp. KACC 21604]
MNDTNPTEFPSGEQIFGWIEDLASLGHRRTGTPQGRASAEYIAERFREFDLHNVQIEESLTACADVREQELSVAGTVIESFWANATGRRAEIGQFRTEIQGDGAEVVYVGRGDAGDFDGRDVAGKIVVSDIEFLPLSLKTTLQNHPRAQVFDPKSTLDTKAHKFDIYSPNNFPDNYFRAQQAGAAGFVGILMNYMDAYNYNEDYTENGAGFGADFMRIPAVWVSRKDGETIRAAIEDGDGAAPASLIVDVTYEMKPALNVTGVLPGQSEDTILIHSHHDAVWQGAVQDASGVSEVLALASYFARTPDAERPKTLMFAATDTHFTGYSAHHAFLNEREAEGRRLLLDVCIEHVGKEVELDADNNAVETGLVEPRMIYVTDSSGLKDVVWDALVRHNVTRSMLLPVDSSPHDSDTPYEFQPDEIISDAYYFADAGIPVVSMVCGQMYLFHPSDTPARIPVDELRPVGLAFAEITREAALRL